jgi:hypothetical protein
VKKQSNAELSKEGIELKSKENVPGYYFFLLPNNSVKSRGGTSV